MVASRVLHRLCQQLGPAASTGVRATTENSTRVSSSSAALDVDYVLLVNDDGPPDAEHSPFIGLFVPHLSQWAPQGRLAVCLPATQQSWRGKAHTPYEPVEVTSLGPAVPPSQRDWVLVTGTPAAACNYAVHHVGPDRFGKISPGAQPLVVSGPNLGDNSGRSFMLSSGTLGAALEAALSGQRAVAVSFRRPDWATSSQVSGSVDAREAEQVEIASVAVCRLLTKLWSAWPSTGVDLYNINVPLGALIAGQPVKAVYTTAADDSYGSVYRGGGGAFAANGREAYVAAPGSDVHALDQGLISVTPLQARYQESSSSGLPDLGTV